ncbi:hypothetical protein CXB51_028917 [Gossypium anomalum]|uniref:Zinc finger PHD-type domain-containing protein n=1 Tax=Gossypium anomalum TaxID=47600 RepID=A0A8J5YZE6_9ROSI|nr:hypothetical protein CXB51_028917 [Gossypium anomalum]
MIVCDPCRRLSTSVISYRYMYCEFNLNFKCATTIINDENEIAKRDDEDLQRTKTLHFSHTHQLTRCKVSLPMTNKLRCVACKRELQDTLTFTYLVNLSYTNHFQHFAHPHKLSFREAYLYGDCARCLDVINGPAYICEVDKFVIHKVCAEMPPQIQKDVFHPYPLKFKLLDIIVCDACRRFSACYIIYKCIYCELNLDFKCTMAIINDENEIAKRDDEDLQRITTPHFSHPHQLTHCKVSPIKSLEKRCLKSFGNQCVACKQELQGTLSFICLLCKFFIHESCMNDMPMQVLSSLFHPHHSLYRRPFFNAQEQVWRYACRKKVNGFSFYCNKCDVDFQVSCAKYQTRATKHSCHPHNLLQLGKSIIKGISCHVCGRKNCNDSIFSCRKCDFNVLEPPKEMLLDPQRKENFDVGSLGLEMNYVLVHVKAINFVYSILTTNVLLQKMKPKNSFHPRHPLPIFLGPSESGPRCKACNEYIQGLLFGCLTCNFPMHYSYAKYQFREIKHNCHADHHILYLGKHFFGDKSPLCNACGQACKDTLFSCLKCMFYIHLECISLPSVVKHKCHLHPLELTTLMFEDDYEEYYCDTCETQRNPEHDIYYCKECNYVSHIDCVLPEVSANFYIHFIIKRIKKDTSVSNSTFKEKAWANDGGDRGWYGGGREWVNGGWGRLVLRAEFQHFAHSHKLSFREAYLYGDCAGCLDVINGPVYICEVDKFVMHKVCAEMPPQIQKVAFHPHPLNFKLVDIIVCDACRRFSTGYIIYKCIYCELNLDFKCAMAIINDENEIAKCDDEDLQRTTTTHFSHPHQLTRCKVSPMSELEEGLFQSLWQSSKLKCVACKQELQVCFTLTTFFTLDLSLMHENKFDVMLVGRKSMVSAFIAINAMLTFTFHVPSIELVLQSIVVILTISYNWGRALSKGHLVMYVVIKIAMTSFSAAESVISMYILNVLEPPKEMLLDHQRKENFDDGSLGLEMILSVSFHPHPLIRNDDYEEEIVFVCDRCEELCIGSHYSCKLCSFNLDNKCATSKDETQKVRKVKTIVNHFSHPHLITRCKIGILQTEPDFDLTCRACRQRLCGIIYACTYCLRFFLHEFCLKHIPKEVQSSFHSQHPLPIFPLPSESGTTCKACKEEVERILFGWLICNFPMHYSCAKYQFREIKHNCHADHRLLHLGKGFFGDKSPVCNACGLACKDTLFSCLKCMFYIHLECVSLPSVVKHKRHLHPLVLTTLVFEDDYEEYYCDTCEEEYYCDTCGTQRNPEHDIYYCKECNYVSHIDCVLSEVEPPEEILKCLIPHPRKSDGVTSIENNSLNIFK